MQSSFSFKIVDRSQYAYMSHFFANPLTILLAEDDCLDSFQVELCEAIRNIPSFRRSVF